jgi:hypothetical protein
LVDELCLLSLRGFELYMTITGAPPNAVCGGPPDRGGHVVIRALGSGVSGHLIHTRALAH